MRGMVDCAELHASCSLRSAAAQPNRAIFEPQTQKFHSQGGLSCFLGKEAELWTLVLMLRKSKVCGAVCERCRGRALVKSPLFDGDEKLADEVVLSKGHEAGSSCCA